MSKLNLNIIIKYIESNVGIIPEVIQTHGVNIISGTDITNQSNIIPDPNASIWRVSIDESYLPTIEADKSISVLISELEEVPQP